MAIAVFSGCVAFQHQPVPDLNISQWKSFKVAYLVAGQSGDNLNIWSTDNPELLDQIQSSLKIVRGGDLWGYGVMNSNKIDLELDDGRKYTIHITSDDGICLNDYDQAKTGFGLDISGEFISTLKTMIRDNTGDDPIFYQSKSCCEDNRKNNIGSNHGLESTGAPPAAGTPETHP